MYTIHDYVRWVAESMSIFLSDGKVEKCAHRLAMSDKYLKMLHGLEDIKEENMVKRTRM